jgi:aerobic-type carbon monoxide dehydrogenase small subunit (CoxS/CutS family)
MKVDNLKAHQEKMLFEIQVNGKDYQILAHPSLTLLEVIRDELHLTGTKQGCDDSNCGACTVLMDEIAVKSCTVLIPQAADRKILTVEGLETEDGLHPLQQAFIDYFAVQCGFCTPGMLLTAKAILDDNPEATEEEVRLGIHGNVCRCTGYTSIVEAVEAVRDGQYGDKWRDS